MTANSSDENVKTHRKSIDCISSYPTLTVNTTLPMWSNRQPNNRLPSHWQRSHSEKKETLIDEGINKSERYGIRASLFPCERTTCIVVAVALLFLLCSLRVAESPSVQHAIFGKPDKYVAFIGNSMMYYYDLPRSLQIVSDYKVQQNCLLSGAGAFERQSILQNGMWNRWRSDGALLFTLSDEEVNVNTNGNSDSLYDNKVYDLGACTMDMLLFGYNHTEAQENYFDFRNYREVNGVTDDNAWVYDWKSDLDPRLNNPCAQSQAYLDFLNNLPSSDIRKNPTKWDYLVIVDRTAGPMYTSSIESGLSALEEVYFPFFQKTKATPIFLVTHGYRKSGDDSSLDEIPEKTFKVYMGYKQYATFVQKALPRSQKPKLVNMGIAFLVVLEENLDLWDSLFWTDKKHPSPLGSFLESCLVHHAVYGRVPYRSTVIRNDMQSLWNETRNLMYPRDTFVPFPTKEEAEYLYNVCKRVAGGYIPPSFRLQLNNGLSMYK